MSLQMQFCFNDHFRCFLGLPGSILDFSSGQWSKRVFIFSGERRRSKSLVQGSDREVCWERCPPQGSGPKLEVQAGLRLRPAPRWGGAPGKHLPPHIGRPQSLQGMLPMLQQVWSLRQYFFPVSQLRMSLNTVSGARMQLFEKCMGIVSGILKKLGF